MKKLHVNINHELVITPYEMADIFWEMDNVEQIEFFNHLAYLADRPSFEMQILSIVEPDEAFGTEGLTFEAKRLLETIRDVMTQDSHN